MEGLKSSDCETYFLKYNLGSITAVPTYTLLRPMPLQRPILTVMTQIVSLNRHSYNYIYIYIVTLIYSYIYIPPPPHSASYNITATTTCASRVSASVGHRKRPAVQVTVATTTCASRVSVLVGHRKRLPVQVTVAITTCKHM